MIKAVHQKERVVEEKAEVEVVEKKVKEKKEQLSKKQKARMQDRLVDGMKRIHKCFFCLLMEYELETKV